MKKPRYGLILMLLMFLVLACSGKTQEKQNQDAGSNDYQTSDDSGSILTEDIIQDIFDINEIECESFYEIEVIDSVASSDTTLDIFDTFLDKPEIIDGEIGNFEIIAEVTPEIKDVADTSENPLVQYIDECPTGLECLNYLPGTFCDPGYLIKVSEIQSICTRPCDVEDKDSCSDLVIATCCGNVAPSDQMPKYFCVPQDICCQPPNFVFCNGVCCPEGSECGEDGKTCTAKCKPPAPNPCVLTCCPNNYDCKCEEEGGFCVPKDVKVCDCAKKLKCDSFDEECIEDESCRNLGKICKSLGGEDCPEAPDCYCEPGDVCTHSQPVCCPSDATVPCGDYCCPADNDPLTNEECVVEIKECKNSSEEYCPKWGIICPIGKKCMEKQSGCKDDGAQECEGYDVICPVTDTCVGAGKGENNFGCCPKQNPTPCDSYCCPSGTHCEAGCGGCVIDGYFCCPDGVTTCFDYGNGNKQICYSGGGACLDTKEQDCGSYYCNAGELCVFKKEWQDWNKPCLQVPAGCCPVEKPKLCGDDSNNGKNCYPNSYQCCPGGGIYCGNGNGKAAPPGGVCCSNVTEGYCDDGYKCCPGVNKCVLGMCCGGKEIGYGYCKSGYECCGKGCMPKEFVCGESWMYPNVTEWKQFFCNPGFKPCGVGCMPYNEKCCYSIGYYCHSDEKCCGYYGWVGSSFVFANVLCAPKDAHCCNHPKGSGYCLALPPNQFIKCSLGSGECYFKTPSGSSWEPYGPPIEPNPIFPPNQLLPWEK